MFNVNSPFWRFLNKMADQFILSLLWMICLIPVFTAGASTAAFFSVSMDLQKDHEGAIVSSFFREFKRLFKRATKFWLMHAPLLAFLIYDIWLLYKILDTVSRFMMPVFLVAAIMVWLFSLYGNALLSRSSAEPKEIWKKAWYMVIMYLPHSFVLVVLLVVGVLCMQLQYVSVIVPAMVAYQYVRIFNWMFDKRDPWLAEILDEVEEEEWPNDMPSGEPDEEPVHIRMELKKEDQNETETTEDKLNK